MKECYRSQYIDIMYEILGKNIPKEKIAIAYDIIIEDLVLKLKSFQLINVEGFGMMYLFLKKRVKIVKIVISNSIVNLFKKG